MICPLVKRVDGRKSYAFMTKVFNTDCIRVPRVENLKVVVKTKNEVKLDVWHRQWGRFKYAADMMRKRAHETVELSFFVSVSKMVSSCFDERMVERHVVGMYATKK